MFPTIDKDKFGFSVLGGKGIGRLYECHADD